MEIITKILNNDYGITFIKKASTILFGVLGTAMISRYLGPELKGEYAYVVNMISILLVVLNLGIAHVFPNFKRENKANSDKFYLLVIAQFIIYVSIACAIFLLKSNENLKYILILTPICVLAFQLNYINLIDDVKISSLVSIASATINFVLIVLICTMTKRNIINAYIIYAIKEISIILLTLKLAKVKIRVKDVDFELWIQIIKCGFIPMITTLLISINYKLDVILLTKLNINFYLIGLYTTGMSLAQYAWIIPDIFKEVMLNRTAKKDDIKALSFSIRMGSTMVILFWISYLLFGKIIIRILFGSEFLECYTVTGIIFIGIYSMLYCKILGTLYISQGKWKFYFYTLLTSVILNIVLNYSLIPIWGIYGAAIASVISYSIAGFVFLINFKHAYKLKIFDLLFINKSDLVVAYKMIAR